MKRILVTGATGNIGSEVVHYLSEIKSEFEIIAAVRNVEQVKKRFSDYPSLLFRLFDFENFDSFNNAFKDIDTLFLLRPPHISEVEKFFRPLLESAKENGIKNIIFLSVQGAEKSKIIPHNKIEQLIKELQFRFIFVRPSYFMQNLTTSLLNEIATKRSITLPSGNAKFNWIDTKNIGETSARLILEFNQYQNKAIEITGSENKSFKEIADLISEVTDLKINYKRINPITFYLKKRK